jgi:hypothetical protein
VKTSLTGCYCRIFWFCFKNLFYWAIGRNLCSSWFYICTFLLTLACVVWIFLVSLDRRVAWFSSFVFCFCFFCLFSYMKGYSTWYKPPKEKISIPYSDSIHFNLAWTYSKTFDLSLVLLSWSFIFISIISFSSFHHLCVLW